MGGDDKSDDDEAEDGEAEDGEAEDGDMMGAEAGDGDGAEELAS